MTLPTPKEFEERNPGAPPAALAAYERLYDTTGKSYNATTESAERFVSEGGRGGYVPIGRGPRYPRGF